MQMKIKEKMIAVVMAFAMMFTFIFAGESSEVIAAAKTKALEINVDFARNAASGDDSGIYGDFYVVNVKIPLDNCDRISASKGSVDGHLFISGFNKAYKGSIYVDDVTLTVDKKSVVKQNYENGKNGGSD